MLNRLLSFLTLAVCLVGVSGCYSTQEGRVKPGVPFAKDSIQSRYENVTMETVHAAARQVIKTNGTLTNDDSVTHTLRGVINKRNVWIKLSSDDAGIVTITTQARTKAGGTNIDLSSEIDKQVFGILMQGR